MNIQNHKKMLLHYDPANDKSVDELIRLLESIAGKALIGEDCRQRYLRFLDSINDSDVIKLIIKASINERIYFLKTRRSDDYFAENYFESQRCDLSVFLNMILAQCGKYLPHIISELEEMVLYEDSSIYFTACDILANSTCDKFIDVDVVIKVMSNKGLSNFPYKLGEAVVKASAFNTIIPKTLVEQIYEKDDNVTECVLFIIHELPVNHDEVIMQICELAENSPERLRLFAFGALLRIAIKNNRVKEILITAKNDKNEEIRNYADKVFKELNF